MLTTTTESYKRGKPCDLTHKDKSLMRSEEKGYIFLGKKKKKPNTQGLQKPPRLFWNIGLVGYPLSPYKLKNFWFKNITQS